MPEAARRRLPALAVALLLLVAAVVGLTADVGRPTPAARAEVGVRPLTDLQVLAALRRSGTEYTWQARTEQVGPSGACGTDQAYQQGRSRVFYVEQQSCAEDVVVPALLDGDADAVAVALRALDWAVAQEAPDGSFPHCADSYHSTMVFLASAARTVLLVRSSPLAARFAARLDAYEQPLLRAARHLQLPEVLAEGRSGDEPYGHRRFVRAAALGLVGRVTGDEALLRAGRRAVAEALSLQWANGVVPELGGHDSHYQAYGMVFATTWLVGEPSSPLTRQLAAALQRAADWEAARVQPDGSVSVRGNTRTDGQESTRDGQVKRLNHHTVARALGAWAVLRDDAALRSTSHRVGVYAAAHPGG